MKKLTFLLAAALFVMVATVGIAGTGEEATTAETLEPQTAEVVNPEKTEVLVAVPSGTCKCNPPPASSGWTFDNETCSRCTDSAACSSAKCEYKHNQHGGLEDTGCQWNSGVVYEPIDREPIEPHEF